MNDLKIRNVFRRRKPSTGLLLFLFQVSITIFVPQLALASQEVAQSLTVDGQLFDNAAATTPLLDTVSLKVQLLSADQTCILYEESDSVNTVNSNGFYNFQLGSPVGDAKRSANDSGHTMAMIYSNTVGPVLGKAVSNGSACTYTPVNGDARYVRILMTPSDGTTRTLSPNMALNAVPSAVIAESAESLQGVAKTGFIQANNTAPAVLTQTNVENIFSTTNYPLLTSLLASGTHGYVSSGSNGTVAVPSESITVTTGLSAGQMWYDTGVLKYYDGSAIQTLGAAGAGITSLTIGTGLTPVGTITTGGSTIAVDTGTAAGKIVQVQTGSKLPALDGSNLTNLNASAISSGTVGGSTAVSTTGNILTTGSLTSKSSFLYDHSGAGPGYIGFTAPNVATSYTMTWPAAVGAANAVLTTDNSGTLSWVVPAVTSAVSVTSPITNSGTGSAPNIGIQQASNTQGGYLSSTDWATFNGKQSTGLASAKIWVGNVGGTAAAVAPSGDVSLTNAGAFTVTGIQGVSVSTAPTLSGQVLRYNGTNFTPNFVAMTDLRSTITGTNQFGSSCTSSQTLTYNSVGDVMSCQNISVGASNFGSQTQNTFLAAPNGAGGTPTFRTIASADLPAAGTANTYGSATQVPVLTTDAYGRVTSVTNTAITASATSLSGTVPVTSGGLGVASPTAHGVLLGEGATAVSSLTSGAGTLFQGNGSSSDPTFSSSPTLGVNGTTTGQLLLATSAASGASVTIQNLAATTAYNFNLPATAGNSGQALISGGGTTNPMTWGSLGVGGGGTGLNAGISGGIPYFASASTMASSALLTSHALTLGGGAGAAPYPMTSLGTAGNLLTSAGGSADPTWGALNLAGGAGYITGTLPTGNGGLGVASPTAHGVLIAEGSSAATSSVGGAGTVHQGGGSSADPTWTATPTFGVNATTTGQLVLANGNASGTSVTIQNNSSTTAYNFNLPAGPGTGGQALLSGGGAAAPMTWGTLGVGAGGTGLNSGTSGGIPYFSSTSALSSSGALTAHAVTLGGGAGAGPYPIGSLGSAGNVLTSGGAGADPTWAALNLAGGANYISGALPVGNGGTGSTTLTGAGIFANGGNSFGGAASIGTNDSNTLTLKTNNSAAMTILSSGYVGVGTATPAAALDVVGAINTSGNATIGGQISGNNYVDSNGAFSTAYSSSTPVPVGPSLRVYNTSATDQTGAMIQITPKNSSALTQKAYIGAVSNSGASNYTPTIVIGAQTGSATYAERMRIDMSGNVGVGTTSPSGKLEINSGAANALNGIIINTTSVGANTYESYKANGTVIGSVSSAAGTSVAFNTTSDVRLKGGFQPVASPLKTLDQIDVTNFYYLADPAHRMDGFKAQQLYQVLPYAVTKPEKDVDDKGKLVPWLADYSKVVPLVTAAIKELYLKWTTDSDALHREIASLKIDMKDQKVKLETEIAELKKDNGALKAYLCEKDPRSAICK